MKQKSASDEPNPETDIFFTEYLKTPKAPLPTQATLAVNKETYKMLEEDKIDNCARTSRRTH